MAAKKKAATFEDALEELEKLVERLETGDLPLEEALADFERGVKLTRECQQKLATAEQKVKVLMEDSGGIRELPFDTEDDSSSTESP
ncbi:exodeoxyribonuclease VII small subunit [Microbulbifer thermotolerans]|uniref:Exodeoxyribonuclease 7 small subunit n=1 Tax=Microbulbifer thermotolerans TaxID=252514 RepID=A0A143HPT5_MICTH|nr:exodeoxyribonuclease VII small subunit [Microbulbifer thermotolerans]AMX03292.1 exodeoxyribonuclease VII small subunit [Microbulbifer thermotolerans]MCX2780839.1 exodeoxyribonuclease VII small subunit [Microbulbifer thermotolerans]MCX2794382.1 exodeoxyribonuclease VII small subunit [Microbulbifer thermotolerans]MCX2804804.1 exodeoxyribonuclease VII small subunit [Microbulbifer thermotolerans]MCX2835011.1 exodeoxyribonuclease VII small subunit [Microbulbifer thermotolerans]